MTQLEWERGKPVRFSGAVVDVEHCFWVAENVETIHEKTVALLHDVLEDTEIGYDGLFTNLMEVAGTAEEQLYVAEVISDVVLLTRTEDMTYSEYLDNLKQSKTALNVKLVDIQHNSMLSRLKRVTDKDIIRKDKYVSASGYLLAYKKLLQDED